jgi:hypothetical protein
MGAGIVVERPAATLTVNEMTVVVRPIWPQSRDPACLPMLSPERRIDPVVGIERRDDDIADAAVAFGVTTFAREFDTNLPKLCRKGCIQDRFGMCVLHIGIAFSVSGLEANAVAHDHCSAAIAAPAARVEHRPVCLCCIIELECYASLRHGFCFASTAPRRSVVCLRQVNVRAALGFRQ